MAYVYLMRSGDRYKIGLAKNVERRWRQLRTADPDIHIEHVIQTHQASQLENELHQRFERQHIDLEWFTLSDADVRLIKSLGGNAGKWIESRRARRRLWRQIRRISRQILKIAVLILIFFLIYQVAIWIVPYARRIIFSIR